MKQLILFITTFIISINLYSQRAYFDYVYVNNIDVQEHINAEKTFWSKLHKEAIDRKEKNSWDMWQFRNNGPGDPTTLFLYVHFNKPGFDTYSKSKIFSQDEISAETEKYLKRVVRTGNLTVSFKDSHGTTPAKFLVANYMKVDGFDMYDYEMMEKQLGPNYSDNGRVGWSFAKVLTRLGEKNRYNYITHDFYNSFEEILNSRDITPKLTKDQIDGWKQMLNLRTQVNTQIGELIMSE